MDKIATYFILFVLVACNTSQNNNSEDNLLEKDLNSQPDSIEKEFIEPNIAKVDTFNFRLGSSADIQLHNDSINSYLRIGELKRSLPIAIDYQNRSEIEKAYFDYCLKYIEDDERYCFNSYCMMLLDLENRYSTEDSPIYFNCDLYFPEEISFYFVDFNQDGIQDAVSKVYIRSCGGHGSYVSLIGFISNEKTFEVEEISSKISWDSKLVIIENKVLFNGLEYAPDDAMCCPSLPVQYEISYKSGYETVITTSNE